MDWIITHPGPIVFTALIMLLPAALGASVQILIQAIQRKSKIRRAKEASDEDAFETALQSRDEEKISTYLFTRLGLLSADSYLENQDIRDNVDLYLKRIKQHFEKV